MITPKIKMYYPKIPKKENSTSDILILLSSNFIFSQWFFNFFFTLSLNLKLKLRRKNTEESFTKKLMFNKQWRVLFLVCQTSSDKVLKFLWYNRFWRKIQLIVNPECLFLEKVFHFILKGVFFINDKVKKYA